MIPQYTRDARARHLEILEIPSLQIIGAARFKRLDNGPPRRSGAVDGDP